MPRRGTARGKPALVNVLAPGDRVLAFETGYFSANWGKLASALGLEAEILPGDWRHGVDPAALEGAAARRSRARDQGRDAVHNETSTGVANRVERSRRDRSGGSSGAVHVD